MPAPRAVLADILNLGLDPKKSHSSLSKNGKLKKNSLPKKQDQDLKPGFVFMTAEKVSTSVVETLKQEKVLENVVLDSNVKEEESFAFDTILEENIVDTSKLMPEEKIEKSKIDSAEVKLSYDQSEKQKKKQAYQKKSFSNNS
jgi:hypothetical protein